MLYLLIFNGKLRGKVIIIIIITKLTTTITRLITFLKKDVNLGNFVIFYRILLGFGSTENYEITKYNWILHPK